MVGSPTHYACTAPASEGPEEYYTNILRTRLLQDTENSRKGVCDIRMDEEKASIG